MNSARPSQQRVLEYRGGRMAVSAVPGSGKTWTLSHLAAEIIANDLLQEDQEVLIVTFTNSAVSTFRSRIRTALGERQSYRLIAPYRVRTLHGLTHDILRERPDLVSLEKDFKIIAETESNDIRRQVINKWIKTHQETILPYLNEDLSENDLDRILRRDLIHLLDKIGLAFIRKAKSKCLSPDQIASRFNDYGISLPLAQMGCDLYKDYQHALTYNGAADFDDLIRLTVEALNQDPSYIEHLRLRWPFILEDEAQDSSPLQEGILRTLSGDYGNWVRVGDPNQAIFETFTMADPELLRSFMREPEVIVHELPHSSRSTKSIIRLANHLIHWACNQKVVPTVKDALGFPFIQPVINVDPNPNPPDDPHSIVLNMRKYQPEQEIEMIVRSLKEWLPNHQEETVAVLTGTNKHAANLHQALQRNKIKTIDFLKSKQWVRSLVSDIHTILVYLLKPHSTEALALTYEVWRRADRQNRELNELTEKHIALIRKCRHIEDFLWPRSTIDWLINIEISEKPPLTDHLFVDFRRIIQKWQGTVHLPVDQIILTIVKDLFFSPNEIAVAYEIAAVMGREINLHPDWELNDFVEELKRIVNSERRFLSMSEEDNGFNPEDNSGTVVISTVHRAKGLEWDRVYLSSVNNYDYPFAQPEDQYAGETTFIRDHLNCEAEALAQLDALLSTNEYEQPYIEGEATQSARLDYVRERLRLLFVGITRAKKELRVSWNTGKNGRQRVAFPLNALSKIFKDNVL